MMLGARHRKVVASTLAEIAGCLPLVDEGLLDEVLAVSSAMTASC